jgi:hypothetical protein
VTYRDFFSHVVDIVDAVGAAILVVGALGAFVRCVVELAGRRGQAVDGEFEAADAVDARAVKCVELMLGFGAALSRSRPRG